MNDSFTFSLSALSNFFYFPFIQRTRKRRKAKYTIFLLFLSILLIVLYKMVHANKVPRAKLDKLAQIRIREDEVVCGKQHLINILCN